MLQKSTLTSTKTIYIIRHGQTDFNQMGIVQGSGVDTDLNSTGIKQAEAFYSQYHQVPFQKIYVSSLKRTHQTVSPFKHLNIPTEILPELNEINWGILEGKVQDQHTKQLFFDQLKRWSEGYLNEAVEGGETPIVMQQRQKVGLNKIEAENLSPVLICMHGRAMRGFLCLLTNTPLEQMDIFPHNNVCLYILEKPEGSTHYNIITQNSQSHLDTLTP